ncbi:hypothetical protein F4825DRAFT_444908 [Nemania diffusa]|nr:hypothetical protein F4825DRAFT_444908 [Nemania diffusa]
MSTLGFTEEQQRTLRAAATILGVPVGTLPTALPATLAALADAPQSCNQDAGPLSSAPVDSIAPAATSVQPPGNASQVSSTSDSSVPVAGDLAPITSSFGVPGPSNGWNAEAQATSLNASWSNPGLGLNVPYTPQFSQPPALTFPSNTTHFLHVDPNAVPLSTADSSNDLTFNVDDIETKYVTHTHCAL